MTQKQNPWDLGFGLAVLGFGLLALFVWFPNDIRGGFIERSPAGKPEPGDTFFPVLLIGGMMVLGAVQVVRALLIPSKASETLDAGNLKFLAVFLLIFGIGIVLMRWTGPILVWAFDVGSYRNLSDTIPWKYLGYIVGGLWMGLCTISWIERRVQVKSLLIVCAMLVVLILIFDIALGTVRLPPNADL